MARPTSFNQAVADRILERLADGKSLRAICRGEDMPDRKTVIRWTESNEQFRDQYTRARDHGLDALAEELFEIADDGTNDYVETKNGWKLDSEHVQRSRLRVDTRKWFLSKLAPKRYGDKLEVEANVNVDVATAILAARKRA